MSSDSRAQGVRRRIIALARKVYAELGWGWREDVYREALTVELTNAGFQVSSEVAMPVIYRGNPLSHVSVRWDMVVDKCVLVELKAVQHLKAGALRQCERCARWYHERRCKPSRTREIQLYHLLTMRVTSSPQVAHSR